jgi:hypothetical protein
MAEKEGGLFNEISGNSKERTSVRRDRGVALAR